MNHANDGDPFAVTDLWRLSEFSSGTWKTNIPVIEGLDKLGKGLQFLDTFVEPQCMLTSLFVIVEIYDNGLDITAGFKDLQIHLPDLDQFQYGPVDTISAAESVSASLDNEILQPEVTADEDIWALIQDDKYETQTQELRTWERFYNHAKEPTTYISDAGPRVLDAALSLSSTDTDISKSTAQPEIRIVQCEPVLVALFQLGLGRESKFFEYLPGIDSFALRTEGCRISGFSAETFHSLTVSFIAHGNRIREVQEFVNHVYASQRSLSTMIAFAHTVSAILMGLKRHLVIQAKSPRSILQLQSLFHRPGLLLVCLEEIIAKARIAEKAEDMLSILYEWSQRTDEAHDFLRPVALQILARTCQPWLQTIGTSIGLQLKDPGMLSVCPSTYKPTFMPCFITKDDAANIFQTSASLQLLELHKPDHILTTPDMSEHGTVPKLEWCFDWTDIQRIQAKADSYEKGLLQAMKVSKNHKNRGASQAGHAALIIPLPLQNDESRESSGTYDHLREPNNHSDHDSWPFDIPHNLIQDHMQRSHNNLEELLHNRSLDKSLEVVILDAIDTIDASDKSLPPLTIAPLLSFSPIISAQARLVNLACLRMLFKEHGLRSHLSLQRHYQLLGDGVFASRLSHALFDPELGSTERRKGRTRAGTMGLHLGSRNTWPPASSELRLALMGILRESYLLGGKSERLTLSDGELPGDLSFSIRDLTQDEIQRCMDPNAIEALDFLRLQYKPPPPLDTIFTLSCLEKYDAIFKLLLKLTRMMFVVNQLSRHGWTRRSDLPSIDPISRHFRIVAHWFVTTICGYFFECGIRSAWDQLEKDLDSLEKRVEVGHAGSSLGERDGLHHLQEYHEQVLDRMMFSVLLRKRQEKVMQLLEDIFSLILLFAKESVSKDGDQDSIASTDVRVKELYQKLNVNIRTFIRACKGMSSRRDHGISKRTGDSMSNIFDHASINAQGIKTIDLLISKLEMNGYYSRSGENEGHTFSI